MWWNGGRETHTLGKNPGQRKENNKSNEELTAFKRGWSVLIVQRKAIDMADGLVLCFQRWKM